MSVEGEDSVLHFLPQYPVKAELHTRNYEPNENRLSCEIGDLTLVYYKDSQKGFILDKNQIVVGHIRKWNLKRAFYEISVILNALKNENYKRNVLRTSKKRVKGVSAERKKEIQERVEGVMKKCL
jgi:hypothetical protein